MRNSCRSSHMFSRLNGFMHCGACCSTTRARCFSKLISFVIRRETTTWPSELPIGQYKEIQYLISTDWAGWRLLSICPLSSNVVHVRSHLCCSHWQEHQTRQLPSYTSSPSACQPRLLEQPHPYQILDVHMQSSVIDITRTRHEQSTYAPQRRHDALERTNTLALTVFFNLTAGTRLSSAPRVSLGHTVDRAKHPFSSTTVTYR